MADPRERDASLSNIDKLPRNGVVFEDGVNNLPASAEQDPLMDRVRAYIEDSSEQRFYNRTDLMRATGRADNMTDPKIQAIIRDVIQEYGGTEGRGAKIKHPRMTREGFIEASRRLGLNTTLAINGRRGAFKKYPSSEAFQKSLSPTQKPETFGRRKVSPRPLVRRMRKSENLEERRKKASEEFMERVDVFIRESQRTSYSIADVMRATGRRKQPTRPLARLVRKVLQEDGIFTIARPEIPEATFRKACLVVGSPNTKLSEAQKRVWQEKGIRAKPELSEGVIHELHRRRGSPTESQIAEHRRTVLVAASELAGKIGKACPREYFTHVVNFFGSRPATYYLLSDIFAATGRSHMGNEDLRRRILAVTEEHGIKRAWKTAPLPIPMKLALAICLEIGPRNEKAAAIQADRSKPRKATKRQPIEVQREQLPLVSGEVNHREEYVVTDDEAFGLVVLLRAPINRQILHNYNVLLDDGAMKRINEISASILQERRKEGRDMPDLETEVLPALVLKLSAFAKVDRAEFLAQNSGRVRSLLGFFNHLDEEQLVAIVYELYNQQLSS